MFYLFLLIVAAISIAVYLLFIVRVVPGFAAQRFGVLEPLPEDLGKWKVDDSAEAQAAKAEGLVREVRHIYVESQGLLSEGKLLRQVRYRDQAGEIVRVDPEQQLKRKRIKPAG